MCNGKTPVKSHVQWNETNQLGPFRQTPMKLLPNPRKLGPFRKIPQPNRPHHLMSTPKLPFPSPRTKTTGLLILPTI
jgi:hypothetical protein